LSSFPSALTALRVPKLHCVKPFWITAGTMDSHILATSWPAPTMFGCLTYAAETFLLISRN
jgi:hypothetical protein